MVSKWNSEEVVKFLDVYENFECLWNIRHSDYNNKIKGDSAMSKLMGVLLKNNVAVEGVDVLGKKIKSIKNVKLVKIEKSPKKVEQELKINRSINHFINSVFPHCPTAVPTSQ
jgi:hypothetical protein